MTAFRKDPSPPTLAATVAFHAAFRAATSATYCLELEGMTRYNADEQLEQTRLDVGDQDERLPRYSEKVGEWLGSVAHFLEDVHWGINTIEEQSQWLRERVLAGAHVGAPCLRLCRYHRRHYVPRYYDDEGALFVRTVLEALAERPKCHWAKARASVVVPVAILSFWRRCTAAPGSMAARMAAKRFKALA